MSGREFRCPDDETMCGTRMILSLHWVRRGTPGQHSSQRRDGDSAHLLPPPLVLGAPAAATRRHLTVSQPIS
ncbi:hypothetical protein CGRA01v4_07772 [Colletotrichum graminicola]|nr:hypothetical protein CGRA01v4_07772 [Colletotrichum graminicola]